jgi:hypothetical protein
MSMDYSEYKRLLGADPRNQDSAFLRARESSPEFRHAAEEADRFEAKLERALALEPPAGLAQELSRMALLDNRPRQGHRTWRSLAVAASLLLAVGAAGLMWNMKPDWGTVPEYVVDHYRHDGAMLLAGANDRVAVEAADMLAAFGVEAAPELAGIISVVKSCPTPDGKGVHMVVNTDRGLITVIFMPETSVTDGERISFDDRVALLVALPSGSAVIVGAGQQRISDFHALVQSSILPVNDKT